MIGPAIGAHQRVAWPHRTLGRKSVGKYIAFPPARWKMRSNPDCFNWGSCYVRIFGHVRITYNKGRNGAPRELFYIVATCDESGETITGPRFLAPWQLVVFHRRAKTRVR